MAEDWPSPHHHEPHPLPRVEDLPVAWEGYDRERVQAAFDAFYRHIAQLDSTLRTLEAVEVFREPGRRPARGASLDAGGGLGAVPARLHAHARAVDARQPCPTRCRAIALEVIFLVVVAAVVAVAEFSPLEIVAVMAGAALLVLLVELLAGRERRASTPLPAEAAMAAPEPAPAEPARPIPAPAPAQVAVPAPDANQPTTGELSLVPVPDSPEVDEPADDELGGWAPFAEPAGAEAPSVMAALAVADDAGAREPEEAPPEEEEPLLLEPAAEAEPLPEPEVEEESDVQEAEPEPVAAIEPEPVAEVEPTPSLIPSRSQESSPTRTGRRSPASPTPRRESFRVAASSAGAAARLLPPRPRRTRRNTCAFCHRARRRSPRRSSHRGSAASTTPKSAGRRRRSLPSS